jgi:hypothetical protein
MNELRPVIAMNGRIHTRDASHAPADRLSDGNQKILSLLPHGREGFQ